MHKMLESGILTGIKFQKKLLKDGTLAVYGSLRLKDEKGKEYTRYIPKDALLSYSASSLFDIPSYRKCFMKNLLKREKKGRPAAFGELADLYRQMGYSVRGFRLIEPRAMSDEMIMLQYELLSPELKKVFHTRELYLEVRKLAKSLLKQASGKGLKNYKKSDAMRDAMQRILEKR